MADQENYALDWTDEVEDSGMDFILLGEGDYVFVVEKLDKERYEGSEKVPPCPRATITLAIPLPDGRTARVFDRILLYSGNEWRIFRFFECFGFEKNENGKMVPHWDEIIGQQGVVRIKQREYTNKNGEKKVTNDVDCYIKKSEVNNDSLIKTQEQYAQPQQVQQAAPQAQPQPVAAPAAQQQQWNL